MKLRELLHLAELYGLDPDDTPVVISRDEIFEQEWSVTADVHPATSEDEPDLIVLYIPEESNV